MSLLRDERGQWSSARCGFWLWTVFTILLILIVAADPQRNPGNAVWSLIGSVFVALIAWAGGPRIAQHVAPQIGRVAQAIGTAARDARLPSKTDDERGERE